MQQFFGNITGNVTGNMLVVEQVVQTNYPSQLTLQ